MEPIRVLLADDRTFVLVSAAMLLRTCVPLASACVALLGYTNREKDEEVVVVRPLANLAAAVRLVVLRVEGHQQQGRAVEEARHRPRALGDAQRVELLAGPWLDQAVELLELQPGVGPELGHVEGLKQPESLGRSPAAREIGLQHGLFKGGADLNPHVPTGSPPLPRRLLSRQRRMAAGLPEIFLRRLESRVPTPKADAWGWFRRERAACGRPASPPTRADRPGGCRNWGAW